MRFACFAGSACAGALACWWGCAVCAPHGGIFIIPLAYHALNYAAAVGAGTLAGAVLMVLLRIGVKMAK